MGGATTSGNGCGKPTGRFALRRAATNTKRRSHSSSKPSELDLWQGLFFLFAAVQFGLGVAAVVTGVGARRANGGGRVWPIVVGVLGALAAPVGAVLAWLALAIGGASA